MIIASIVCLIIYFRLSKIQSRIVDNETENLYKEYTEDYWCNKPIPKEVSDLLK